MQMNEVSGAHSTRNSVPPYGRGLRGAHRSTREMRGHARSNEIYKIAPRITHIDRAIIRSYFAGDASRLPQERRGNPRQPALPMWLPPQVEQHALPRELECKLSLLPEGYERVLVGRDVILVEPETRAVVDVLHQSRASNG